VVGPGAFAAATVVGGRMEPYYRHRDEAISALAAHGTRSAPVMVPGFFALAFGTLGLARALRGSAVAPAPVPAMLTIAGLGVAGAGVARNSDRSCPTRALGDKDVKLTDDLHAAFATVCFGMWIATPLVAARRAHRASPSYRRWSRVLGLAQPVAMVANGLLAKRPAERGSGTAQRANLAAAFAWYLLAGAAAAGEQ